MWVENVYTYYMYVPIIDVNIFKYLFEYNIITNEFHLEIHECLTIF